MAVKKFVLAQGDCGPQVEAVQIALAGFGAGVWDGIFGPRTAQAVLRFQQNYMGRNQPQEILDEFTRNMLLNFENKYSTNPEALACPCGECDGFGRGRFRGEYRANQPCHEAFHRYEYPGMHRALLAALRAATWHLEQEGWGRPVPTSGYRCWEDNARHGRTTTNHMGKAVDWILPRRAGETRTETIARCDRVRELLVDRCGFQIGWDLANRIALEPASLAPTWIHMDLRTFDTCFLEDRFFVRTDEPCDPDKLKRIDG